MVGESDLGGMYEDETSGTSLKKRVMGIRCPPCRVHLSILFPSSIHLGCSDSDSRHPRPMNWWHKMRRIWVSVSPRVKPRKPGVAGGETGIRDDASGLLKLRDDVKMCAYNDVQVMWNMLSKSPHPELKQATAAAANTQPRNSKCSKHRRRFTWRFPFWSDHTTSNSSLFR